MKGQVHGGRWDGMSVSDVIDLKPVAFRVVVDKNGVVHIHSSVSRAKVAAMLREIADTLDGSRISADVEGAP